jgi:hypothetical protein
MTQPRKKTGGIPGTRSIVPVLTALSHSSASPVTGRVTTLIEPDKTRKRCFSTHFFLVLDGDVASESKSGSSSITASVGLDLPPRAVGTARYC